MQKFGFAGEDLVLVAKADTGSTVTIKHTLPDKTVVTPDASMTEDATTGNFYFTFNHADVGTHILELKSTDDTSVDGMLLSIVNFATSNADIAAAISTLSSDVSAVKGVVDGLATNMATSLSNDTDIENKVDTITTKVDDIQGVVGNNVGWV